MKSVIIVVYIISLIVGITFGRLPKFGFPEDGIEMVRITNGKEAKIGEAPFIVSLSESPTGVHFCGGSLIASNRVLTAAHCIGGGTIYVTAGLHNRKDRSVKTIKVMKSIKHEQFKGGVGPNDIAILHLENDFQLSDRIQVVNLPTELPARILGIGKLYGWGIVTNNALAVNLQMVETDLLSYNECKRRMPGNAPLSTTNICSSSRNLGISACNGDSGGPLVNEKRELVGIVSWGMVPCGQRNLPSVYTSTASFLKWIQQNMVN